ncbi:MAG: methyltransferase [Gemmataceae bacterium]|nr:methyltransferase [Gemmataceae bacterium]
MKHVDDLFTAVADRVKPPVCVALGPPWPAANLAAAVAAPGTVCYQMDLHQAARVRDCLAEVGAEAEVVARPDLWDLDPVFQTVVFPAAAYADRELKIDIVEQAYHVLKPGGLLVSLSGYERDNQFAKWHKKIFGKCGQTPASKAGMAFWSAKADDGKRRRHEVSFHAKLADGPGMEFVSRPGTFSYGHFDNGSRAMVEVADMRPGDSVLDLGCGNGAVDCLLGGVVGPQGSVTFVDSNLRAVALAELNAATSNTPNPKFVAATRLEGLPRKGFDVIVANPPYYAKSDITQLFVRGSRELLRPGGRYYIVTKMPTAVVPMIFEVFGDCSVIENRGYSVVMAGVGLPPPLAGGVIPRVR